MFIGLTSGPHSEIEVLRPIIAKSVGAICCEHSEERQALMPHRNVGRSIGELEQSKTSPAAQNRPCAKEPTVLYPPQRFIHCNAGWL